MFVPRKYGTMIALLCLLSSSGCLSSLKRQDATADILAETNSDNKLPAMLPAKESVKCCLTTARSLEQSGHFLRAARQYEIARVHNPNLTGVSWRLAVLYDRKGMHKQAHAEYLKAMKERPKDANLLNNFGYHYYNRGQWKKAEDLYRKALALNSRHNAAWVNLGLTLAQQMRYEESMEAFQHAIRPAEAMCNLAFILTTQGEREEAKKQYRQALAMEPNLRRARLALNRLEESKGSKRRSRKLQVPPSPPSVGGPTANLPVVNRLPDLSPVHIPARKHQMSGTP